ncbi:hypothetical protein HAX54_007539 [Datura stramonium]|uniref:Trichome birefringence-like C-terminal domain-containing protein n=1 Tax=Datura stramonium TaxID=4076 RepID=A0ABS8TDK4_DATST|nr:hypothetical protein [Datura stramonium]
MPILTKVEQNYSFKAFHLHITTQARLDHRASSRHRREVTWETVPMTGTCIRARTGSNEAMRKDAHPSIYSGALTSEQRANPDHSADCSHWCLAGLPDTWNQLFYTALFF